jgi:hypothetical protein
MQRQPRATPVFQDVSCMKRSFRFHWRLCEPRAGRRGEMFPWQFFPVRRTPGRPIWSSSLSYGSESPAAAAGLYGWAANALSRSRAFFLG